MSGFKRYQSKVFWSHMEAQDAAVVPSSPSQVSSRPDESASSEDNLDDTNVTVIHVDACDSLARSEEQSQEAAAEEAGRSLSPQSRGQRSQDSGFSDSGRSDCSSAGSPRRRRRRASSRRLPTGQGPQHTSTPKRDAPGSRAPIADVHLLARQLDFTLSKSNDPESREAPSPSPGETLDDFLFAGEPPLARPSSEQLSRIAGAAGTPAVRAWLDELASDVEDECMTTLLSKSLPKRRRADPEPESRDLRLLTASATTAAKKVIDMAHRFDKKYERLASLISKSNRLEEDSLRSIEDEAMEILLKMGSTMPRRISRQDNLRNVTVQLARLKMNVDKALDKRLDFYIEKVVRGLEEAPREGGSAARGALAALTALGLAGGRAGASVARCSGVRALLTSLVSAHRLTSELRCCSLRALACVCSCLEAVEAFVAEDGPDILADVLVAGSAPQRERAEAAALLVQITAEWMQRVGLAYVEPRGRELVAALTELAVASENGQTLLLAAAALNNLAHSDRCIGPIVSCDSVKKLLRCVKKSGGGSVHLMEQVAGLIGEVARSPGARAHLAESRASVALVCFLRMTPPGLGEEHRKLANTARDALARLCVEPEIARQVVAVGGSDCLPGCECANPQAHLATTKSIRLARKIAAEQIDIARISDRSPC